MSHKKNQTENELKEELFLHTGDVLHIFKDTFLGSFGKFMSRKSFTGTGIYLDINGYGMVVVNYRGRIMMMRLDEFVKINDTFIKTSTVYPHGYMKQILQTLGKKQNTSHLVAKLLDWTHPKGYSNDGVYHKLNEKL